MDDVNGLSRARVATGSLINELFLQALFYMIGRRLRIKTSELEAQVRPDPPHAPFLSSTIGKLCQLFRSDPVDDLEGCFTDAMDDRFNDLKDHFDDLRDGFELLEEHFYRPEDHMYVQSHLDDLEAHFDNLKANKSGRIRRHVAFLSSLVVKLWDLIASDCIDQEEIATLADRIDMLILRPLLEIRDQTETRHAPALDDWELWSAEQGFDVQACYILELFVRIGRYIDPAKANDSSIKGCMLLDRMPSVHNKLFALHDRSLVKSLRRDVMARPFRKVLQKKLSRNCGKLKGMYLHPYFPALVNLRFQPASVALTRFLEEGSDATYPRRSLSGKPYHIRTGRFIMHPSEFKPGIVRRVAPWLAKRDERRRHILFYHMIDKSICPRPK
jgi:hypothetical protein